MRRRDLRRAGLAGDGVAGDLRPPSRWRPGSLMTPLSIALTSWSTAVDIRRRVFQACGARPPTRSTRCGSIQTPSFATAAYTDAIWIGVTEIPCPIGTLPIVVSLHWASGRTKPGLSPGKSMPVG